MDNSLEDYSDSGDEAPPCTTSTTTDSTSASPPTGAMITPRQFTIKAEKDKQKDWKGSIRLGRHNLRTLMEMKTLDFYDHAAQCSLKCQSRNYIKNRRNDATGEMLPHPLPTSSSSIEESISKVVHTSIPIPIAAASCINSHRKASSSALEDYVMRTVQPINGNVALANLAALMNGASAAVVNSPSTATASAIGEQAFALRSPSALAHHMSNNGSSAPSHHATPEKIQPHNNNSSSNFGVATGCGGDAALLSAILQMLLTEQQQQQQQVSKVETMGEHQASSVGKGRPNNHNATFDGWMGGFRREIRQLMEAQPVSFWTQMKELGICEDLLATLCATIDQLRQLYLGGGAEEFAAQKLSQLSALLDLDLLYAEKILNRHTKSTLGGRVDPTPSGLHVAQTFPRKSEHLVNSVPERRLDHPECNPGCNGGTKLPRKSLLDEILYGCATPHYRTPQTMNYE